MKNDQILLDVDFTIDFIDYLYGGKSVRMNPFHRYGMAVE